MAISALRAGPCGPVALRNGAAAPVRNAPAGAAPAAPINFLIFIMCGGVKTPPYRATGTGGFPVNPAWRAPLPGGIYASPTNTRYRVYDTGDGWRRKVYGPHACGPWPFASQYRFLVVTAFGLCVGAAYMPPAKRCNYRPFMGCMTFILHCRAGDLSPA